MEELIYHYTSLESFKNILETRKFYATNIFYTKDFSEFFHGRYLINFLIDYSAKPKVLDKYYVEFENLLRPIKLPRSDIYFLSFSKNGNDLSQWREYARDGICVAIDPKKFEKNEYHSCIYDNEEKRQKLLSIIGYYGDFIKNPSLFNSDFIQKELNVEKERIDSIVNTYFISIVKNEFPSHCIKYGEVLTANLYFLMQSLFTGFSVIAKQGNFQVENEIRYLYTPQEDSLIKIKVSNNLLTPFFEVSFDLSAIQEIWFNSKNSPELMEFSIQRLWANITNKEITTPRIIPANLSLR